VGKLGFVVSGFVIFFATAAAFVQLWGYVPPLPRSFPAPPPLVLGRRCAGSCTVFAVSYLGGLVPTVEAGLLLALSCSYLRRQSTRCKVFLLGTFGASAVLGIAQEWGGPFPVSLLDALTILFPIFLWLGLGGTSSLGRRNALRILLVFSVVEFAILAGDLGDWVSAFVIPPTQPTLLIGARGIYDGLVLLPVFTVVSYAISIVGVEILRVIYCGMSRPRAPNKGGRVSPVPPHDAPEVESFIRIHGGGG
jgi:hypothetical protein